MFLGKDVLKLCSKFTREQPSQNVISLGLLCNFLKIMFVHGCSPVNLLHIFRTLFSKNTSGRLLLGLVYTLVDFLHFRLLYHHKNKRLDNVKLALKLAFVPHYYCEAYF